MVDPISLTGLALAGLAGGGAAAGASLLSGGGGASAATPAAPAAPAPTLPQPTNQPQGAKPVSRSQAPSFLGASATPPVQSGSKSLLGQ